MQENLSFMIDVLLLVGVLIAISRVLKGRKAAKTTDTRQPNLSKATYESADEIIAVRKVEPQPAFESVSPTPKISPAMLDESEVSLVSDESTPQSHSIMFFLLAKDNRELAGYELLQTVLAAGLRFGDGHLFHRHQHPNGQGPVLCSLAAATQSGVFDLQNIGAFSVRGLCLFMHASGNPTIDGERFNIMLDTAKKLSEGLDALLLDEQRQPLSQESLNRYQRLLNLDDVHQVAETV